MTSANTVATRRTRRSKSSASYSYVPDWAVEHNAGMPDDAPVVDIYARLSRNPLGELEKIEDQIADSRAVLDTRRWRLGMIHVDNSLSAWDKRVRRPGWERLLEQLDGDKTSGVVVYHQDRLMRQPRDLEKLIDIADRFDKNLASAHGARDLNNPDDRFIARIEVAKACRDSDDASRRRRRRNQGIRERGRLTRGPRAFGFPGADATAERVDGKRPPAPAALVERERDALRQASEDIAAGVKNLQNIADVWNAEGLRTSTGDTWVFTTVRLVLTRPRNAGIITHKGQVVGKVQGEDPIVPEDLYDRVMAVFNGRTRGRVPEGAYLASGMLYCGRCGATLAGRKRSYTRADGEVPREYFCFKSRGGCNKLSINVTNVDRILRKWTIEILSSPEHTEMLAQGAARDAERLAEIDNELEHIRRVLNGLAAKLGSGGDLDLDEWEAARAPLVARRTKLSAEREELDAAGSEEVRDQQLLAHRDEITELWDDGTREGRRILLARALRTGWRVVIQPGVPGRARVFDPARVDIVPAHG